MYLCFDCDRLFEEPKKYTETHGFDCPPYETWYGCPYCGGPYVETMRCDECGEWITGDYIEMPGEVKVCDKCFTMWNVLDK